MKKSSNQLKKVTLLIISAASVSFFSTSSLLAAENASEGYLAQIANNTSQTLAKVNELPVVIKTLSDFVLSWLTPDDSESTAIMQENFAKYAAGVTDELTKQNELQATLQKELLGTSANRTTMPYANDLLYTTLLGTPLFNPDPRNPAGKPPTVNPAYNYLKNAAAVNFSHKLPGQGSGSPEDQMKYYYFYSTTNAVQSYDAYILSKLYTDYANGGTLSKLQSTLLQQATSSDWFAQVASENLGPVLRQILMYESQTYVLLSQMAEVQKQALAAQAMTNSLLVLGNSQSESQLWMRAKQQMPGG